MFDIDKMLKDLEAFNEAHDKELNPTRGEKDLQELKQAVAKLKEERKANAEKNKEAMKEARDRSNNVSIDRYVAMVEKKRKEFKDMYY